MRTTVPASVPAIARTTRASAPRRGADSIGG
jgi:hypothetical protein